MNKAVYCILFIFIFAGCVSGGGIFGGDKPFQGGKSGNYMVKKELAKVDPSAKSRSSKSSIPGITGKPGGSVPFLFTVGTTFDGKPLFFVKTVTVSSTQVTIHVWDDALEDGDIITLYLNDRPIVSNFRLKNSKHTVNATLKRGKANTLYLYAHNLGEYPPNTAAIQLEAKDETKNFVLSSTLESSQGVQIEVK